MLINIVVNWTQSHGKMRFGIDAIVSFLDGQLAIAAAAFVKLRALEGLAGFLLTGRHYC